jgi:hypothetical protein
MREAAAIMKHLSKYSVAFFVLSVLAASSAYPRQAQTPPPAQAQRSAEYPDTPKGLQQCLTGILAVAKSGDKTNLAALLKDMEIPNFANWFNRTYGKQKGRDSAELYRMNVDYDEVKLAQVLAQFTQQDGQVSIRTVNAAPQSALESAMLHALRKPVNIYFASWDSPGSAPPPQSVPIGYFLFIDGKFRWDTAIRFSAAPNATSLRHAN